MIKTDLLIVGGGPAGLSAALFFSRLRRPVVVYDSGVYRNANSSSAHTILGNEGVDPAEYRRKAKREIEAGYKWCSFRDTKVVDLKKEGDLFRAKDAEGEEVEAKRVVLATGISDILPDISGLADQWGRRVIHCIFCHGTETADGDFAFLLPPASKAMNPMIAASAFKLWTGLGHRKTYFLTHGSDVTTQEGKEDSGLSKYMEIIQQNPDEYEIISDSISSVSSTDTSLQLHFASRPVLEIPYMAVFPVRMVPPSVAVPLLTKDLLQAELSPMGAIAPPSGDMDLPQAPPRMGEDPRTNVPGLYWAGNSGSPMANVNLAVAQGQTAAAYAAESLCSEELEQRLKATVG